MVNINNKEYWDNRFETNWVNYDGDKQTEFFARLMCLLIPNEIKQEIVNNTYTVCDMGCAQGEGTFILSRELGVFVSGVDFSEKAIDIAKTKFPELSFHVADIKNNSDKMNFNVIICSNVLEHFVHPWDMVRSFTKCNPNIIILMVPYREKDHIDEHVYQFNETNIPHYICEYVLQYSEVVDGRKVENTLYPGQQILLIYRKISSDFYFIGTANKGILRSCIAEYEEKYREIDSAFTTESQKNTKIICELNKKNSELEANNKQFAKQIENISNKNDELKEYSDELSIQVSSVKGENLEIIKRNSELVERNTELEKQVVDYRQKYIKISENSENLNDIIDKYASDIEAVKKYCKVVNAKKYYRLNCMCTSFVQQLLKGDRAAKKQFFKKLFKRLIIGDKQAFLIDDGQNLVVNIQNMLHERNVANSYAYGKFKNLDEITIDELEKKYDKPDIIFLSVISYGFRFQRPQQFAKRFSENGYRVFYIDADFVPEDVVEKKNDNLYVIKCNIKHTSAIYKINQNKVDEWSLIDKIRSMIEVYAITDAVIVTEYPNWSFCADVIRREFGFKIITDYLDDYTGFLATTTDDLKYRCVSMLQSSDMVISSSQYLHDIAEKYCPNSVIIRNGTEVEHFQKAQKHVEKGRPIVGYYGAISDWFDWEKVCYVAQVIPECDVWLIGEVTAYADKFAEIDNISLLGEVKYDELPEYLEKFDVCLIPFDTSTNLIKATNPVKFYEYLSAGKKVVATEIPELFPYKNKYLYMSNNNEEFAEYVKKCIEGSDLLKEKEKCISFAGENDWQKRFEVFSEKICTLYPKISVIILTYNNLELNIKCIDSVLNNTAYPNYELIIMDNCSTDGTREYLTRLCKEQLNNVKVILSDVNLGFAAGNNRAIAEAEGEYYVLLNNDTIVTRGWLTTWLRYMEAESNCGMIGAVTNSIGNEAMIEVDYKSLRQLRVFSYCYICAHRGQKTIGVDRIALFGTMIRKIAYEEVGGLDEKYKVGMFEDDDFSMALRHSGWKFYISEDVFIHHVNNASFSKLSSEEYDKIFNENKKIFEKKWDTDWIMPKCRDGVCTDVNSEMMSFPV